VGRIYLSIPHMGGLEERYVHEAFETNWLSTVGPNLENFERAFSELAGGQLCVALASGTAAMHLGLRLLGVRDGDEVVCPSLTFVASVNPVVYLGARPVLIDSERSSWNVDPALLDKFLRDRAARNALPRAVIVVHLYGQSADLDPILTSCARYDVPVLEDAAEALGTHYKGRQVGTFAPIGVFSFNGNKIITTTGGGMLVAHNPDWVQKARFWSQQARDPGVAYHHTELGYNYRMSNVLAGIGRGQLAVLEARVNARRAVFERYRQAFADLDGLDPMPEPTFGRSTRWLSVFLVDAHRLGCSRDALLDALAKHDIGARPVWKPMHLQPLYRSAECHGGEVAADLFARGICFPSSSSLKEDEQARVIQVVREASRA
jgi:pyridoxal phosphate-dependent aminotransferase EpsN